MDLSILSNVNMDPIKDILKKYHFKDIYISGYNQYFIELANENSFINTNDIKTIFIHLDGKELLKDKFHSFPDKNFIFKEIADFLKVLDLYIQNHPKTLVIISTILLPPFNFLTYLNKNTDISFSMIENDINQKFFNFIERYSNIINHDFKRIINLYGYNSIFDEKFWYLGRIRYTNFGFQKLALDLKNLINGYYGKSKKVLILDLDNTLWGGIIGEDGLSNINLSEEGVGKIYRDFQKNIKSLKEIGVLLAICSKNNKSDVKEVFGNHPMMILKNEDFIVKKINWNNKVQNIEEIASELNLGLNSFVFIDDNPVERQIIKNNLPEVEVPDFPEDISALNKWFLSEIVYKYFPKVYITEEDKKKTFQYERNIKRKKLQKKFDISDFIKSLNINLNLYKNPKNIKSRLAQLTQKTNQFNLTTRRYSENDIENFIVDENTEIYGLEYEDKFGNEGIIGESIIKINKNVAIIDTFLMSCRVIGRNVEFTFLYKILKDLTDRNIIVINAEYISTKKNVLVKDFYRNCGFKQKDHFVYTNSIKTLIEFLTKKIK